MIERFVDPKKIDLSIDCIEVDESYIGEKVSGKNLKAFELVEGKENVKDGVEIIGKLEDVLGIIIEISGIDDLTASALESLIPEIMNRIKGLRYDFRKENVVITISEELFEKITLDCIGKLLYKAFNSLKIGKVHVKLIADRNRFYKELAKAYKIHKNREMFKVSEEEVEDFYGCISCQVNLPNHVCIITPERPSPCGTTWREAKAANKLGIVEYYFKVEKGRKINGEFEGVNKKVSEISDGKVNRVKLHSALNYPPLTGLYSELIVFYIPEKDGFGIVDRSYKKKTPIGLTFDEIEKLIVGKQVEGFVGISYAYLKSPKFLIDDKGWNKVLWITPNVYSYIRNFNKAIIKNIEIGFENSK